MLQAVFTILEYLRLGIRVFENRLQFIYSFHIDDKTPLVQIMNKIFDSHHS